MNRSTGRPDALVRGLLAVVCLAWAVAAPAQGSAANGAIPPHRQNGAVTDTPLYLAPMMRYGSVAGNSAASDDQAQGAHGFGETIRDYLALEVFAYGHNDEQAVADYRGSNLELRGYGLNALLFPMRDIFPVFGLVGFGAGQFGFDSVDGGFVPGIGHVRNQDLQFVDVGVGFLVPIDDLVGFDMAVRAEYRYRDANVHPAGGETSRFGKDVLTLELQIPLGSKPEPAPPAPGMVPTNRIPVRSAVKGSNTSGVPNRD